MHLLIQYPSFIMLSSFSRRHDAQVVPELPAISSIKRLKTPTDFNEIPPAEED